MENTKKTVIFNPFLPSYKKNPYDQFKKIRSSDPLHFSETLQAWIVLTYDDANSILSNNQIFSSSPLNAKGQIADLIHAQQADSPLGFVETVITSDPPTHTRLRSIVSKAFVPKNINLLTDYAITIIDEIIDKAVDSGQMDIMADLAQPVPVKIIARMLGVPVSDYKIFKNWSDKIILAATNVFPNQNVIDNANHAIQELSEYFKLQIENKRDNQISDDIISQLIAAENAGNLLMEKELVAFIILLLVAGNETTTNLVGNGIATLFKEQDILARIVDKSIDIDKIVEEILRVNSPVIGVARFANKNYEMNNKLIQKGDTLLVMVGAANHDPNKFTEPELFDFNRVFNKHLSFGHGIHYCLGASLARMETSLILNKLVSIISRAVLEEEIDFESTFFLRWPKKIQIKLNT
ncbi:MAG: hypothetical protein DK305_000890 [Chloroflexi bacterium]|jgi:cytochrome P450|nr:MAG: hypothetical protein DK305_000890 [Chloroflexota bacterium]|tara:strand:+ start:331 stop:1557 length:1227 start_codon:yes stop_codon:yes gene_type:complete